MSRSFSLFCHNCSATESVAMPQTEVSSCSKFINLPKRYISPDVSSIPLANAQCKIPSAPCPTKTLDIEHQVLSLVLLLHFSVLWVVTNCSLMAYQFAYYVSLVISV